MEIVEEVNADSAEAGKIKCLFQGSVIFSLGTDVGELIRALTVFQEQHVNPKHIESRPSNSHHGDMLDYFVDVECSSELLDILVAKLQQTTLSITVHRKPACHSEGKEERGQEQLWFPRSIRDLYKCCTNLHRYGSDLTPDHPGYGDPVYQERRKFIAAVAYAYRYGEPIPRIEYTEEEFKTWGEVFRSQIKLYPTHACKEYNAHFPALFEACNYREDTIPQLEDVSRYLRDKTGWQLWPVVGWIPARDFLAALAFRTFPTSQYIRHSSSPLYTPEPDICHELMGHAPLFCDPTFAQFSQEVGLASLGVSDEWIEKLATLYWFTAEFGMCKEDGIPKAYGAGLLSGSKELQYCVTQDAEHKDFDIRDAVATSYPETGLQPLYFVVENMDDMRNKMIDFAKTVQRPFTLRYNPYTQNMEVLDKNETLEKYAREIHHEMGVLHTALQKTTVFDC